MFVVGCGVLDAPNRRFVTVHAILDYVSDYVYLAKLLCLL